MGGVLEDVPKPERIAPGSRAQTVAGIADRVAIIQSEFRGIPEDKKPRSPNAIAKGVTPAAKSSVTTEPDPSPDEATAEADTTAEGAESTPEKKAPPRRRRRAKPTPEPEVEVQAAEQEEAPAEDGDDGDKAADPSPADGEEAEAVVEASDANGEEVEAVAEASAADDDTDDKKAEAVGSNDDSLCRLFLNIGKRDNVSVEGLRETLADYAGLLPEDLIDIRILYRHSYITIDKEFAEDLLEAVNGEALGRKVIRIEFARND